MEVNGDSADDKSDAVEASSSNIASDEIDQETANKLRGDAIGDTMYSEVFVLNLLMQFSDLKWNPEIEDNLCFLWDMTEEKDVCEYLFKVSYPSLAREAVQKYNEPRFIEIIIGIFANLLCSQCEKTVSEEEIKTMINLLSSDDPYILIQVMRFVHAVSFMFDKLEFIEEEHLKRFDFILSNSTNKELLTISLKALSAITESTKIKANIVNGELMKSAITGYRVLREDCETDFEMFQSQEKYLNVKHLIEFVCNMCSYIDILNVNQLVDKINSHLHEFTNEIVLLLTYYKTEDTLLPVDDEFRFYIEALAYIYRVLQATYISAVAKATYEIVGVMHKKDSGNLEFVAELFCYFISTANADTLKQDFSDVQSDDFKEVLSYIRRRNFRFEFEYERNLVKILEEL